MAAATAPPLRVALLLGSTRAPPTLGSRVGRFLEGSLRGRGLDVDVVDARAEALPWVDWKPEFAQKLAPEDPLAKLGARMRAADAFVVATPEYNHLPAPALLNLLNHFGGAVFALKPSAIATYSVGQWGGARAAQALRPALSELGCLPVSALIHIPKAGETLDVDGVPTDDPARWESYLARSFTQLEFWARAAKAQRQIAEP